MHINGCLSSTSNLNLNSTAMDWEKGSDWYELMKKGCELVMYGGDSS
jgi:hypothetical protein